MKATRVCSIPGCERPPETSGFCRAHYMRRRRGSADPDGPIRTALSIGDRLLARRAITPEGCWVGSWGTNRRGYAHIKVKGKNVGVHRVAYEAFVGPIPAGMEIDHVAANGCVNRNCFNPDHLEVVTHAENIARSTPYRPTHCPAGHALTDDNVRQVRTKGGKYVGRRCRACFNEKLRKARKERAA